VTRAWLILALLGVGLVAIAVVVGDRLARSMVRAVGEQATVARRLAAGELDARARPVGPPEIRDVTTALNHLAARIRDLLREEREAVADLSHRLRTPLTALRLDAESVPASAAGRRIAADIDALERSVTDAINEARKLPKRTGARCCDAATVVRGRLQFWSVLAEDTDRAVDVDIPPGPLPVAAPADELAAAVDALLGNVFAHTPDGTRFAVSVTPCSSGGARLIVTDAGAGFPEAATHRILARGVTGNGSTGLGLDIVRRVAQSSGGAVTIGSAAEGGAQITVDLGGVATDHDA
jgi:signal transduction histidine kinase